MNDMTSGALRRDDDHVWVEQTLARYPDVSPDELDRLRIWFTVTASALDAAMLASNERIQPQYRQYRAEHLDRLGKREMIQAAIWITVAVVVIGGLVLMAV